MGLKTEQLAKIRVMVIAEAAQQRLAFRDTISKMGMTLVECIAPNELQERHLAIQADIWLVDSQYDDELYSKLDNLLKFDANTDVPSAHKLDKHPHDQRLMLVGFEQAPELDEINLYAKWQRKLKRKLASMLSLPALTASKGKAKKYKPWRYVVYLAAGPNNVDAVKAFLDNLPSWLPVTILLAQQVDKKIVHSLPSLFSQDNDWRYQVISLSLNMQAGYCYIAPLFQKIVCDSTGRVIVTHSTDELAHNLDIGDLLENCSDAFGDQLISILFDDLDDETINNLNVIDIKDNNSQIWWHTSKTSKDVSFENHEDEHSEIYSGDITDQPTKPISNAIELAQKLVKFVESS